MEREPAFRLISCLGLKIGGATAAQRSLWQVIYPWDSNVGKNSPGCYGGDRPGIPALKEILDEIKTN